MAKKETVFFCQQCGYESPKWMGQCPACKEWNSFVEETVKSEKGKKVKAIDNAAKIVSINSVE